MVVLPKLVPVSTYLRASPLLVLSKHLQWRLVERMGGEEEEEGGRRMKDKGGMVVLRKLVPVSTRTQKLYRHETRQS
jgi:hypothetical protein